MFKFAVSILFLAFLFPLVASVPTGDKLASISTQNDVNTLQTKLAEEFAQQIGRPESKAVVNIVIQVVSSLIRTTAIGVCPSDVLKERVGRCGGASQGFQGCKRSVSNLEREILDLILRSEETEKANSEEQAIAADIVMSAAQKLADLEQRLAKALISDDQRLPEELVEKISTAIHAILHILHAMVIEVCPPQTPETVPVM